MNDEFIDYIEPNEHKKKFNIPGNSARIKIMVNSYSSNVFELKDALQVGNLNFQITSQIQNPLFVIIFSSFFIGGFLALFGIIDHYIAFLLALPLTIIIYWRLFKKHNYLRLTRINEE